MLTMLIGLLLAAILTGQQLINNARVRNIISQDTGVRTAYFAFVDRYGALPGDYANASANLKCATICLNGNGNGRIQANAVPVDGSEIREDILVWSHLSAAGYLNRGFNMLPGESAPTQANSPANPYNSFLQIVYDGNYGTLPPAPLRHNAKTGNDISVAVISEVDRKIDDGAPNTGEFQFSPYAPAGATAPTGGAPSAPSCTSDATAGAVWNVTSGSINCGGASLL